MPILTPRQFDNSRARITRAVFTMGWRVDDIKDAAQSEDAIIWCVRQRVPSLVTPPERVPIRIEPDTPLEDTVKRVMVHLKMKG